MNGCGETRVSLGVYVLGAIEPAERSQVETHLEACPACRDELAGLAGLPALLGRVDEAQLRQVTGPPPELLDTLLARAAAERRKGLLSRLSWAPLAAACVLLLVGALLGGLLTNATRDDDRAAPVPSPSIRTTAPAEVLTAADPSGKVKAKAVLYKKRWGTSVNLYLSGAPYGAHCRMSAVARDGRRDILGSWYVAYRKGYGQYDGSTMFQRDQLFSLEVATLDGRPLITIPR